jgi:type III secretion protein Q
MESTLVAPLAAALEPVGESSAALSRLLFGEHLVQALTHWLPGLAIRPASPAAADEGKTFGVNLRGPAVELRLRLPWAIDAVSASVMAAGSWSPAVQLACLCARANAALGGLLDWLGELGLRPVGLDGSAEQSSPLADGTRFECRIGPHRIDAQLRCLDGAWPAQARHDVLRRTRAQLSSVAGLPVPVCAVLGSRRIALWLLRSLGEGDVVLLGRQSGPEGSIDAAMLLVGRRGQGALAWPCAARGREITATGDLSMNTETLGARATREQDAQAGVAAAGRLARPDPMADLEVDLHFELQVLSTPLGELAAMRPGYVLELPVSAADACVDLVVGGQVHGRAQLVRVGDRLGARILEIFNDAA